MKDNAQKKNNTSANKNQSGMKVKNTKRTKEIAAVVLFFLGIFMFFSFINKTGAIGRLTQSIMYGIFGQMVSYVVMCFLIVLAWTLLRNTASRIFDIKTSALLVAFVVLLGALIHTVCHSPSEYEGLTFFGYVSALWNSNFSGGLIGGSICLLLFRFVEKVGALVILIPATLIVSMLLFSLSLMNFAQKTAVGFSHVSAWFSSVKRRFATSRKAKKQNNDSYDIYDDSGTGNSEFPVPADSSDIKYESATTRRRKKFIDASVEEEKTETNFGQGDALYDEEIVSDGADPLPHIDKTVKTKGPATDTEIKITTSKRELEYVKPPVTLLQSVEESESTGTEYRLAATRTARKLEEVMKSFGIEAKVIHISRGSSITRYELQPHSGVKVSRIKSLSEDIALNLAASGVRIEAPIPGKAAIGIEIPNSETRTVYLKDLVESDEFVNHKSPLAFCLGEDITGVPIISDISKMPHLLIAGSTGSGKSVCVNCMIMSLLYRSSPDDVRFIMIDPKVVELSVYNGIPHLLIPVVTEPKKAASALAWAVQEMENRYKQFSQYNIRDISSYNVYAANNDMETMPRIVIIVDELADLMMVARDSVEEAINRIAQKARAAGMHLIVATQRPSVDVVTGLIKANISSRIAFKVASQVDSKTILDVGGAEKLIGRGDMLYYPNGSMKFTRVQGGFVSDGEIESVVEFLTSANSEYEPCQDSSAVLNSVRPLGEKNAKSPEDLDEYFGKALAIAIESKNISASYLQRRLSVGYSRASRLIDQMEEHGYISVKDGNNPRHVLIEELPEEFASEADEI